MTVPTWPPATLTPAICPQVIAACESLSAAGGGGNTNVDAVFTLVVVHMAALLTDQDFVEARHLWRRNRDDVAVAAVLQPWWKVGAAALAGNVTGFWQALQELATAVVATQQPHQQQYCQAIGDAYRRKLVVGLQLLNHQSKLPAYATAALGFTSEAELQQYLQPAAVTTSAAPSSSATTAPPAIRTDLVAFLETRMKIG